MSLKDRTFKIMEYKKLDLRGGILVDGLPSTTLVNAVAANYLVASLNLDQIAFIDSYYFPPVTFVFGKKPRFPARVYASEGIKLAVFLSEFNIPPNLHRDAANAMYEWAQKQGLSMILSPTALVEEGHLPQGPEIIGVGSTDRARDLLIKNNIRLMDVGVVTGIPAVLLCCGRWDFYDIISLVVRVSKEDPVHRASAKLLEVMAKIVPNVTLDLAPLYKEAETIEAKLKNVRKHAEPAERALFYG